MPKINITKSAVRDFVRSEYLKRYEPLKTHEQKLCETP